MSTPNDANTPLEHARAFELLPWLVNGTLAGAERVRVETHVRDCLPCRVEIKAQRSLLAAVRAQPTIDVSTARGFDRLLERLDGPGAAYAAMRPERTIVAARFRWLAGAAAAAIAAVALFVVTTDRPPPPAYVTLTDAATDLPAASVELDLVFAESVSAADRQQLLEEIGATVVSGPSALGRYRVRLATAPSAQALEELLAKLGGNPQLRFAGRALLEEPQ